MLRKQHHNCQVTIVSIDKDFAQLITGDDVKMMGPNVNSSLMDENAVIKKWGVRPNQMLDLLAIAGDSVDNVAGIPGLGPKLGAQILQKYDSLDQALDAALRQDLGIRGMGPKRTKVLLEYGQAAIQARKLMTLTRIDAHLLPGCCELERRELLLGAGVDWCEQEGWAEVANFLRKQSYKKASRSKRTGNSSC